MRPFLPAALALLALAACGASPSGETTLQLPGFMRPGGAEADAPPAPPPLPAAVQAALPPGVPASVVLQDSGGCYLYSIERTDPPSGYPLRDAAGNPICESTLAPVTAASGAPIDIAPVLSAPAPGASVATATPAPVPAGASPVAGADPTPALGAPTTPPPVAETPATPVADAGTGGGAFAPGTITPPAPLAPLN